MRRTIALLLTTASFLIVAHCTDNSGNSSDASPDSPPDICDLDAYTGNGKSCPYASGRLCFQFCEAGGSRCVESASGPVWKFFDDPTCDVDCGPLDDCGSPPVDSSVPDTSVVPDSSSLDGGLDASDDGD